MKYQIPNTPPQRGEARPITLGGKYQTGAPVTNPICNGAAPLEILISKRGVSLYLALMIMTTLLAVALGISSIFLGQTKMIRTMGYSVLAFYAADAGIEEVLMRRTSPSSVCTEISPCSLDNGAQYHIVIRTPGVDCVADNYCITSVGIYQETRRAIEIEY